MPPSAGRPPEENGRSGTGEDGDVAMHRDWTVSCRDAGGRRRAVQVYAEGDHVVLVAPPGETAVLSPLEVGRLRAALRDAVVVAAMHGES